MTISFPEIKSIESQQDSKITESQEENKIIESKIEWPVKKNKEIKPLDIKNVQDWINAKIYFKPYGNTSLKRCYEAYTNYLEVEKEVVPLTKKSLSSLLRDLLKEEEGIGKVRFYQRSYILIKVFQIKTDEMSE